MKSEDRDHYVASAVMFFCILLALVSAAVLGSKYSDCERRHGVLVRQAFGGYVCMERAR